MLEVGGNAENLPANELEAARGGDHLLVGAGGHAGAQIFPDSRHERVEHGAGDRHGNHAISPAAAGRARLG